MRQSSNSWKLLFVILVVILACVASAIREPRSVRAAEAADMPAGAVSCAQFMAPKRNVAGKTVGQEDCQMKDLGAADSGKKFHRIEVGVTGTLSGWIVKEGARSNHFTSAPDFVFTQMGNMRPRFHGILRYEAAKGTSLTLLYPETGWNGKFFVMVHGVGGSFLKGSMRPWDQYGTGPNKMSDVTKYELAMLNKGYAVARSRRNADREAPGDYEAVLDDGTVWPNQNINQNPELILDEAVLVRNLLKERLGKDATRIYWYGHSAGAHMGLLVNYIPEANQDGNGKKVIDGFIDDDPGGGLYVPVLMKNGQDVLFRTADEKAKFVRSLIVAHQLYPNEYTEETPWEMELKTIPKFVNPNYLANKRTTARVMKEKGVGGFRMYEVKGVSHNGGESLRDVADRSVGDRDVNILDLSRLIDGVVDMLDEWVEKGTDPPATKSEAPGLGRIGDAINLPETACPLGVYFAYPPLHSLGGVGETGFAPFDGGPLEPLDGRLVYVDMNGDGQRGKRETVTEAWRRLGLLKADESFSRPKYVLCVQSAVAALRKDRFITEQVGTLYVQEAEKKDLPAR